MGLFAAIFGLAGAGVEAAGKLKAAKAEAEAAKLNAALVRERTGIELTLAKREGVKGVGATLAAFGAAGVVGTSGSAADVLAESRRDIAHRAESLKNIGEREAVLFEKQAKAAKTAGKFGAASSVLGGLSSIPF